MSLEVTGAEQWWGGNNDVASSACLAGAVILLAGPFTAAQARPYGGLVGGPASGAGALPGAGFGAPATPPLVALEVRLLAQLFCPVLVIGRRAASLLTSWAECTPEAPLRAESWTRAQKAVVRIAGGRFRQTCGPFPLHPLPWADVGSTPPFQGLLPPQIRTLFQ